VFKIDPFGNYTLLYTFTGGADGGGPGGGVIGDPSGNLYGTAAYGGYLSCALGPFIQGCGAIFKLNPDGQETVLYAFGSNGPSNAPVLSPNSGLAMDRAGNLYGAASTGQLFKLDTSRNLTVLYTLGFSGFGELGSPVVDVDGNVYDTDPSSRANPGGEVFKVSPEGQAMILHGFTGGLDGAQPMSSVILDSAGNLYGTTNQGGSAACGSGCGVVFEIGRRENHVCAVQ
jgi:uncharacterized repeat protein (TIGR03803 family)